MGVKHGGFGLRLDGGAVMNDGSDVAGLVHGTAPGGMGDAVGLAVDYALEGGFVAGVDFLYGPARTYDVSFTGSSATMHFAITDLVVGLSPGWRFKLARHWLIEPRVLLGYQMASVGVTSTLGYSGTWTASGMAIWPQLRGEYLFGNWGVGGQLGYLMADASPVKDENGKDVQQYDNSGKASTWVLKNGGVSFAVFGAYHFNPPF